MQDVELVIFDCDGVLVDSEVIACRVDAEELRKIDIAITDDECMSEFIGVSSKDMRVILEKRFNVVIPDGFFEMSGRLAMARIEQELEEISGISRALANFPYKKCVASSSLPPKIELCLKKVGLYEHFKPHIFSSSFVKHGKPAPDIFLYAANALGVPVERCVVIEDSTAGVLAAKAAGMRSIGFYGGSHCGGDHPAKLRAAGATVLLDHMDGLLEELKKIKSTVTQ